jgi:predicted sulfurtransferase
LAFHRAIEAALGPGGRRTAIIDARNIYETRIGRFDVSEHENAANVTVMDPKTR